jgi:AraC-like DNA-binding protein
MHLLTYVPRPPLSEFVQLFWLHEGDAPPHARERLLPTGTVELVINLRDDPLRACGPRDADRLRVFRGPLVCGPHSEFFVIDTTDQASILGVHFKPGGAFPFLGLPAGDLHNQHAPLDALWGARAAELRDRLLEARTPPGKFRVLEQCLLARAAGALARHPAVAFALRSFQGGTHAGTVADVTEQVGLSPRSFIQRFTDEVGLTPKLYCRVQRFQQVLHLIDRRQTPDWPMVALACGYYDQAHFIHDFRAFSGLNPTAYVRDRGEHLNHIPLPD